ncbi:MAG TPA: galactokinase [Longimicrobiales bacterium]
MLDALRRAFADRFGPAAPAFLVRAPGRVNLIGEHIDYNGLSVFPMAIQREIRVLVRPRDDVMVRVANLDPAFPPRSFQIGPEIEPYPPGDWGNYLKAAARELARRHDVRRGVDAVVASDLPPAAGLSSSSAMVIAAALALLHADGRSVPALELAESLTEAERYVGTRSGGMDQAIVLGATPGTASRVDFGPLRLTPTPVPPDWTFVVAHSLVRAEKSAAARDAYNRRTRECGEALAAVCRALAEVEAAGTPVDPTARSLHTYPRLADALPLDRLLALADESLDDVLRRRFRHVVTEAARVRDAERAMAAGDAERFGRLMLESHRSLRDDYEVSAAALDELVERAVEAGAHGARLTGAGFGGCVVALCDAARADPVLAALAEGFYRPRGIDGEPGGHLFVARPVGGASVEPAA